MTHQFSGTADDTGTRPAGRRQTGPALRLPATRIIAAVARHELRVTLRSRWVVVYAALFAVLTLAVSYFGLAVIEYTGFQDFGRTAISLLNLVLYIVPLATMLMAVQSFRAEGGLTDQLFAEPVTMTEIVLGKLLGLVAAHGLATVIGFGITGILVAIEVGPAGMSSYVALVGFTLLAGTAFISLAAMLTILSGRTLRAYAVVLVAWFLLVLLYDLVIIGVSFVLPEYWANRTALVGIFLNPVDATRVGATLAIAGREVFGPAGAQLIRALGGIPQAIALLVATLLLWISAPVVIACRALNRQDL